MELPSGIATYLKAKSRGRREGLRLSLPFDSQSQANQNMIAE
jgi:hypothetical protein